MTCKDCLHVEMCKYTYGENDTRENCSLFIDRSKFVELPCKVGDVVYFIEEIRKKKGRKVVTEQQIMQGRVDNFIIGQERKPYANVVTEENYWFMVSLKDILTTREEAERALKK